MTRFRNLGKLLLIFILRTLTVPIHEMLQTLPDEGYFVGIPTIFIRHPVL